MKGSKIHLMATVAAVALICSMQAARAQSMPANTLPTGGHVISGGASISTGPGQTTINQSSGAAIINWNDFSIGANAGVHFNNGSGATLNRVQGNIASQIDGSLTGTGAVYLVNPSGIAVGPSGRIETGGSFVGSTLDISDEEFAKAARGESWTAKGDSGATVVNAGRIGSMGGDVALISRQVENSGSIDAPEGTAALVAGREVLVRDKSHQDGRFSVKVGGSDTKVTNSGSLRAAEAELRANGGNVYALAGNRGASITARGVEKRGGRVFLTAGDEGTVTVRQNVKARKADGRGGDIRVSGQRTTVSAKLDASGFTEMPLPPARPAALASASDGGTVIVTGEQITLDGAADVDVSGARGGLALVGGDFQGGKDKANNYAAENVATAKTLVVSEGADVRADGQGDGGRIVLWSDEVTDYAGHVSATSEEGRGGDAEVSGKAILGFNGTANLMGAEAVGTLLLDPYDLEIVEGNGTVVVVNHNYTSANGVSKLGVNRVIQSLAVANVSISTGNDGSQSGDITVSAPIKWSSAWSLKLRAHRNIVINAEISNSNIASRLDLTANGNVDANSDISVGNLYLGPQVKWRQVGNNLPKLDINNLILADDGQGYGLSKDISIIRAKGGDGSKINPYVISDAYGLQGMATELGHHYILDNNIDASHVDSWNNGKGFVAIGQRIGESAEIPSSIVIARPFLGSFNGNGFEIRNLKIGRSNTNGVSAAGLFGYLGGGAIVENIGVNNINVNSRDFNYVGGIAGYNSGVIRNVYSIGVVAGTYSTGGLVGTNTGTISQSYTDGIVGSSVNASYPTGAYSGSFAGINSGLISDSYSLSFNNANGSGINSSATFVGSNSGRINNSIAFSSGVTSGFINDFVKLNTGEINGSFSITHFNLPPVHPGADVDVKRVRADNAYTKDSYSGLDFNTTWYLREGQTIPMLRMELDVMGKSGNVHKINNLHQLQLISMHAEEGNSQGKTYHLISDINFTPSKTVLPGPLQSKSNVWRTSQYKDDEGGYGFVPIGTEDRPFQGTIKGNGFAFTDVFIDRKNSNNIAIFGYTGDNATVEDIFVNNGEINGLDTVSGIVAMNSGRISQTAVRADVVVNGSNNVGGLVGRNSGTIERAFAKASVNGSNNVGGLVAFNEGQILNAYSTGRVTGTSYVGGFVGWNSGAVQNAYSTGSVTGNLNSDGFAGENSGIISDSFVNSLNQSTALAGVTPMTLGEMADTNGFMQKAANWDFESIWAPSGNGHLPEFYSLSKVLRIHVNASAAYGSSGQANFGSRQFYGLGSHISGDENYGTFPTTGSLGSIDVTGLDAGQYMTQVSGAGTGGNGVDTYRFITTAGLTVTPAPLTIRADDQIKTYGEDDPNFTFTHTGLVNGDDETLFSGSLGRQTGENVRPQGYAINGGTFSAGRNYTVNVLTGKLDITPAALTVKADDQTKAYGDTDPALTFTATGLKNGDTTSIFTGALSREAGENVRPEGYGIELATLAAGQNYLVTYQAGKLQITPASLTVTADDKTKVYGEADPALTYTVTGLKNGDDASVISGALSREAGENVRPEGYAIQHSSLSTSSNYKIVYQDGKLQITPASLTVAADDKTKIYGDADPALTYTVAGLKNGDDASVISGALSREAGENVRSGGYGIELATLAAGQNYLVTYQAGKLQITPASLTVTADDKTKVQGDADPALTFTVAGLKNGDDASVISGALSRAAGEEPANYEILQGGATAGPNYTINYVSGRLVITAKPAPNPGTNPGTDPGTDPGTNPGTDPGTDPGTNPGTDPGTDPGTNPGTDPGTDHGTNPGTDPSIDPGTNPGNDPDRNGGTTPVTDPNAGIDNGNGSGNGDDASTSTDADKDLSDLLKKSGFDADQANKRDDGASAFGNAAGNGLGRETIRVNPKLLEGEAAMSSSTSQTVSGTSNCADDRTSEVKGAATLACTTSSSVSVTTTSRR